MRKVSLREIVADKIVFAILIALYYWMWARTDWKDWYPTLQLVLGCFLAAFFAFQQMRIKKYKKEGIDEMAERNLKRCDSFCLKVFVAVMVVVAWGCAVLGHVDAINMGVVGWIIVLTILILSIIRTLMFVIIDSKGV